MELAKLVIKCPYCQWLFEARPPDAIHSDCSLKLLKGVSVVQTHGVEINSKYIGFREQTIFPEYFPLNPKNHIIIEKATEKRHHITIFETCSRFDSIYSSRVSASLSLPRDDLTINAKQVL